MRAKVSWFGPHLDAIRRFFSFIKRTYGLLITIFFCIALGLYIMSIITTQTRLDSLIMKNFNSPETVLLYAKMINQISLVEWIISLIAIVGIVIWAFFSFFIFILLRLSVDLFYQFFYPVDREYSERYRWYLRFLYKNVGKKLNLTLIPFTIVAGWILIKVQMWNLTSIELAKLFGKIILFFVPIVYIVTWFQFLLIRRSRRLNSRFDEFLFSQHSIRKRLKNIFNGLIFLAVLGWIVIPVYFKTIELFSDKGALFLNSAYNYNKEWILLKNQGFFPDEANTHKVWQPPSQNKLHEFLNPVAGLGQGQPLIQALPIFQSYLFLVVVVVGLLEIGIPVTAKMFVYQGFSKTMKRVFIHTIKTTTLVIIIYFIAKKAYFINLSTSLIGFAFSFILSIFFALDADVANK